MKITYNWLKEYVDFDWDWRELVERLTMSGLEMETAVDLGERFRGVVVGRVTEVSPHPNADRLSVCRVDLGDAAAETIVCGAPNVAAGQLVPVIRPGFQLPNGTDIRRTRIRGVDSAGMICSEVELGLGEDAAGIIVLPDSCRIGAPFAPQTGLEDIAIDFEVTPNRPDCLSVVGIAREVAALAETELRMPPAVVHENGTPASDAAAIEIEDPEGCPRYAGRVIRGLRVGPSPDWLRHRLLAVGQRPINNVVDATNFVMLELGQPLHAFDLTCLDGRRIVVRRARPGERLRTLDGADHVLDERMLVIADQRHPVALAGIMGGADSEVTEATSEILLESAYFHPGRVRLGARCVGAQTEASSRFERGADWAIPPYACDRAAALIAELTGGEVAPGCLDVYPRPQQRRQTSLRTARLNALLATDLSSGDCRRILDLLGCETEEDGDAVRVTAPSFRPDLEREVDLIEEVGRIHGYDRIEGSQQISGPLSAGGSRTYDLTQEARQRLCGLGMDEVVTCAIVEGGWAVDSGRNASAWELSNPPTESQSHLRTTLVPSLLDTARRNFNHRAETVCIFELGRCFGSDAPGQNREELALAGLWSGMRTASTWRADRAEVDYLDLKGIVENLLEDLDPSFTPCDHPDFREGHCARIDLGDRLVGHLGEVAARRRDAFDLRNPVYIFDLDFTTLAWGWQQRETTFRPLAKFPPIERDLALVLKDKTRAADVVAEIRSVAPELIEAVELFDIYQGDQIGPDQKSLAFSIRMRSSSTTLEDRQADDVVQLVIARLGDSFGARLR